MSATTRVDDLSQYGKALDDFPPGLMARQARIFVSELRRRYGLVGLARLIVPAVRERRRIEKRHGDAVEQLRHDWGSRAVNEALTMAGLFNALVPAEGRDGAYQVVKGIFQRIAPYSMNALYQSADLARCHGDPFTNFKTFHLALFDASHHLFPNTQTDQGDLLTTTITRCANVEAFGALGCPELGQLGCDHDLAGYPAIADRHQFVFRRPSTIAKGGDTCEFRFYRKGTEPTTEVIEGVPMTWNESLNR